MRWVNKSNVLAFARYYTTAVEAEAEKVISGETLKSKISDIMDSDKKLTQENEINDNNKKKFTKRNYVLDMKKNLTSWIDLQNIENFPSPAPPQSPFKKLFSNPVRKNIPNLSPIVTQAKFQDLTTANKNEIIKYFKELGRFSYPKKEKIVQEIRKSIYDKYKSFIEIRDENFYFNVKKNNGQFIERALRNSKLLYQREQTYLSLLEMTSIFKNSKLSLVHLASITKQLVNNEIPISNELIYKLYYTLPLEVRKHFTGLIEGYTDINIVVFDSEAFKLSNFDQIKDNLLSEILPFSYGSYIQLSKLMVKENRVIEGLNLIQHLIFINKCEIPLMLAKYTTDLILAHDMHLCVPAAISLQRITGCSLKVYVMNRVETSLIASNILNDEILLLLRLFFDSSNWKVSQLKDEVVKNIEKSDHENNVKENYINQILIKENEFEQDENYKQLKELFRKQYTSNDILFRPGSNIELLEPIFKLFPSYHLFQILRQELHQAQGSDGLLNFWNDKVENLHKSNPPLFSKISEEYVNVFIERNEQEKVLPFVKFMRSQYKVNIDYTSYLKLFINIVKELDSDNLNKSKMGLAVLLARVLNLNIYITTKAFNDAYPIVEEIYDIVELSPKNKLLNEWLEIQYDIESNSKIPPV
ncbi:hypothetical protein C6P40_004086 [Pichia californica]|uniref:ATPase expression protein 1 n=1 Tax=Pichia californica TaxID=460514 RepID=A0A9P6WFW7_9ASCO|nr:hypothetical protein C6P42_003805 [[Candida] californica]KAG0686445.1 hypothetical protein C6P40_004086 [[Candida] californica]